MSFFDRVFRPRIYDAEVIKTNATNHRPAFLKNHAGTRRHTDNVHPHQPLSIYHQKTNFENLDHRDWQSKHNPHMIKLTQGVANFLLKKIPYPFMYAEIDLDESTNPIETEKEENSIINETKAESSGKTTKNNIRKPKTNAASGFSQDPQRSKFPMSEESMDLFGRTEGQVTAPQHYTLKRDLMDKYMTLWLERDAQKKNMFGILRKTVHKALATQCAVIIRRRVKGKDIYFVFGSNQIVGTKGPSRLVEEVGIRWSNWTTHEDTTGKLSNKEGVQWFKVGKDCVFYVPFPCEESPRGTSFLQSVWDLGIFQQQNRYLQSLYLWNGFVNDRYYRFPNTIDDSTRRNIEDHMKAPMLKPGVAIDFPPGSNPETIDKMFQVDMHSSQEPAWDIHNEIYNQDSPFPKMFLEGQVESGALGGTAPDVDKQKEDEAMLSWFHILDSLIKDINVTFFQGTLDEFKDVTIIPFIDELLHSKDGQDSLESTDPLPSKDPQKFEKTEKKIPDKEIDVRVLKKKTNSTIAKVNSITDAGRTYIGNLFNEGWLPQDDGTMEWLDGKTIKKLVNDPKSIKEGYFGMEHPKDDPMKIKPNQSIGKFKIIGYDENKKTDITEFMIFDSDAPDEIFTSPAYYSSDITRSDGSIEQTNIQLANAVLTKSPRSRGRTKAIKIR